MQDLPGVSEPSREHVEAVAVDLHDRLCDGGGGCAGVTDDDRRTAEALLTSTWLPVLDAMQDALVRAGWLVEERVNSPAFVDDGPCPGCQHGGLVLDPEPRHHRLVWGENRRFVTEWTEARP